MEYDTGAVRDDREGKGRFDLISKEVLKVIYDENNFKTIDAILYAQTLIHFINGEYKEALFKVLKLVNYLANRTSINFACIIALDNVRNNDNDLGAVGLMLVANRLEEGAKHYGERNWEKGIPIDRYIDSGLRHLIKAQVCNDEDHWGAFIWNLHCIIHEHELERGK